MRRLLAAIDRQNGGWHFCTQFGKQMLAGDSWPGVGRKIFGKTQPRM